MTAKDLINKAAQLHCTIEGAEKAKAELRQVSAQLKPVLAPREGTVVELWTPDGWRHFRIVDGELSPFEMPKKVYVDSFDTPEEKARQEQAETAEELGELASASA